MRKVMLILSVFRTSDAALEFAIAQAVESGSELVALYIVDTNLTDEVFDKFTDSGFIGDRPSAQLAEAVMKEYRQRGYEELGRVQVKAMEEGVGFNPVMVHGTFVECAHKAMMEHSIDLAVTAKRKRSFLARYFSTSDIAELRKITGAEIIVFEDEVADHAEVGKESRAKVIIAKGEDND